MSATSHYRRVTVQQLIAKKQHGEKIVTLTAYDYSTAKIADQTGVVDFLLVGDSLGMVVLGYPDTLSVTMDEMIHHVKAVSRGAQRAMVVADMPFGSVHVDQPTAVANAVRMMQEGRANAVKIEGASELTLSVIRQLTEIGVPVVAHLGFTPQSVHVFGGFKVQGKSIEAVKRLIEEALAVQSAGAFAVVLEMVPDEVAALVTRQLEIPTIGIGAGPQCDGQILVIDDFMGKFPDFKPKFVRTYMNTGEQLQAAIRQYATDILAGDFPNPQTETFHYPIEGMAELRAFEQLLQIEKETAYAGR